jgi:hypothetical protein
LPVNEELGAKHHANAGRVRQRASLASSRPAAATGAGPAGEVALERHVAETAGSQVLRHRIGLVPAML